MSNEALIYAFRLAEHLTLQKAKKVREANALGAREPYKFFTDSEILQLLKQQSHTSRTHEEENKVGH